MNPRLNNRTIKGFTAENGEDSEYESKSYRRIELQRSTGVMAAAIYFNYILYILKHRRANAYYAFLMGLHKHVGKIEVVNLSSITACNRHRGFAVAFFSLSRIYCVL